MGTVTVLVWRMGSADGHGIPYRDERARSVIIGATEDLGDGESVWFRVLPAGGPGGKLGDRLSWEPVVAEVRDTFRARERCETATGMYRALGWVFVEDPRELEVSDPPLGDDEILAGWPLVAWAETVVEQFLVQP
jgi:hypothetical protein